jgi:DedD protein
MDQNIKNRLVGISVIFALAVIFLPMILDGSGVRKDAFEVEIPPQPVVESNPQFDAKIIELNAKAEAIPDLEQRFVDEVSSENPVTATPVASDPVEKKKSKPETQPAAGATGDVTEPGKIGGDSWVLQIGSYQDRKKALMQRDKLRKSNISAVFIEQFNVNNKPSYRVRLGPFINRQQARVAQNKVKAKHDIDGIIMKYER